MRKFTPVLSLALVASFAFPANAGADVTIRMLDNGSLRFSPVTKTVPQGTRVIWRNDGNAPHDSAGLLPYPTAWRSPTLSNGDTYARRFNFAGAFRYRCTLHSSSDGTKGMAGSVRVPLRVSPKIGNGSTTFTIRVADVGIPEGWAFEVQRRVDGGDWVPFRNRLQTATTRFHMPSEGTHSFRARLERISPAASNKWSPVSSVQWLN